jgi:pimeloyl-ACP methyl ester carboxylesterase
MPIIEGTHYELTGTTGPTLTLVHGGWLDSRAWTRHVSRLARSFRVLTFDVRGYGRSRPGGEIAAIDGWGDQLRSLWTTLGIEVSHLLGFSMGGLIALDVTLKDPDRVASLILVSATSRFDDPVRENFREAAEDFGEERYEADLERHLQAAFSESFRRDRASAIAEYERQARAATTLDTIRATMFALAGADYSGALRSIRKPALIINGSEDPVTGDEHAVVLVTGLADSRRELIAGAGHSLHLERPELFCDLVEGFIGQQEAAAANLDANGATAR